MLHGVTDSGLCWSRVATALANDYDCLMLDARKGEVYAAVFSWNGAGFQRVIPECCLGPEALLEMIEGTVLFAGEATLTYRADIVGKLGERAVFAPAFNLQQWLKPNDRFIYASLPGEFAKWESQVKTLDAQLAALRKELAALGAKKIEALTVSLINSFANDLHERRVKEIANEVLPGVPVSLSSEVVPEMQEYERTVTTVANSYVRPRVQKYVHNLQRKLEAKAKYVVSGSRSDFPWQNTIKVEGDLREAISALKAKTERGVLVGAPKLAAALEELGLIDEYRIVVHPIISGRGPTLFHGLSSARHLELLSTQRFKSGVQALHFRRKAG